jgi:broad specificity phosphatase PhoE
VYDEWKKTLYGNGKKVLDGENFEEIIKRADDALDFLGAHQSNSIVVVSHSFFIHTLVARILLKDSITPEALRYFQKYIRLENTGITVLRQQASYDDPSAWVLWIHNDHAHLGE